MKKEIQENYFRYRSLKKNNYRKIFFSSKKHSPAGECKQHDTVIVHSRPLTFIDNPEFTLEAEGASMKNRH
jgi:hypothetical protein